MHQPDTFPRCRSGSESGFLAYRCGGSAGIGPASRFTLRTGMAAAGHLWPIDCRRRIPAEHAAMQ
jgi:hypothetical protein